MDRHWLVVEPAGGLVMRVVVRENKELIELRRVVVEGVSAPAAVKDVFSKAAIKDVVPVAASEFVIAKTAVHDVDHHHHRGSRRLLRHQRSRVPSFPIGTLRAQ